jgi:hypothetical protein
MDDLLKLAERCEQAAGPGYTLDCGIWDAIYPGERDARFEKLTSEGPHKWRLSPADRDGYIKPLRAFTASLDAAMTLVPEGCDERVLFWRLGNDGEGGNPGDFKAEILIVSTFAAKEYPAVAATAPLALCAAALRARASTPSPNDASEQVGP